MTRPEPPLITRMRLAAERSAAVSTPEDWKRSAVGHYTYAEAEEAMAWIAEVRANAWDSVARELQARGYSVLAAGVRMWKPKRNEER